MILAATFAGAADDPGGWSKARWGMTDAQLAGIFGADAHRNDHGRLVVLLTLANFPCDATMIPDQAGLLDAVLIEPVKIADMNDALYLNLQELLVQKYGRPWKASEENGVTKLQWTFQTTLITLDRAKFPGTEQRIVGLVYKRITPDSNPL
jgi:hypothetical protein